MSEPSHNQPAVAHKEHGTTTSYVIGYILSLIFTIIPYFLVVNKIFAGNALLAIIIGIAILQMFIQIFFFLHLGRGPKPLYNVVFFFATAGVIVLVIGASLFIMSHLYRNMSPNEVVVKMAQKEGISQVSGEETGACQGHKNNHVITISGGNATPALIEAARCDTLTFNDLDDKDHTFHFGFHPNDVSYGGEDTVELRRGRPETITLNETGDFVYHDHQNPYLSGRFIVR